MAAVLDTSPSAISWRIARRFLHGARAARVVGRAALLAAALFLTARAAHADWDAIPPEAWQEPARPDSGGGDAIMLLDRSEYRQRSDSFRLEYFARAKVFTAEGRDIGNVEVPYFKGQWKLSNLRGRSVAPGGRTTELDPAQIIHSTVVSTGDFDLVKASATIPGIEPGCIVEWSYTLEGPSGDFSRWSFQFANRFYTCVSSHTWHPSKWDEAAMKKDWQYYGIHRVFVEETCLPNRDHPESVTFTARCQPGVRDEEMAPPVVDATPHVVVYYFHTSLTTTAYWSKWKHAIDLYQDELGKSAGPLEGALKVIREHHPEPESALVATYRWIQSRLNSNSELSAERWPDRAKIHKSYRYVESIAALLGRSEASPIEINTLMALAARQLGFSAFVGLVGDRRFENFDYRVMGFPPFNFITVVKVNGHWMFLQPDSRFETCGSIPWYLRGGYCLVSGNGSELFVAVPAEAGARASSLWNLQVSLNDEGAMDGSVEAHMSGEAARGWRSDLWNENAADWIEYLGKTLAQDEGPKTEFEKPAVESSPDSEFVLRGTAHWPNIASVTGDRIVVPFDRLIPWRTHAHFASERRKQLLLFRDARTEVFRVRFRVPTGMTADHLPDPQEFRNSLGSWSQRWNQDGSDVVVERRLDLEYAELRAQDYRFARDLFRSLEIADHTVLLVARTR